MPMSPRLLRPRQNQHPEAADWANRVRANGGTVSGSTLAAVGRFCRSIDAAGIRSRFYRLSLFCGDNLLAALVPLFRSESLTATVRGNTTDTNNGAFVSANYALASGLQNNNASGNGSNYLDTGVPMNFSSLRNYHLSAFIFARNTAHNYHAIGADTNTDNVSPRTYQAIAGFNTNPLNYAWYNIGTDFVNAEAASNSYLPGLFTGVGGTSANNLYVGGSSVASAAAAANETNTRTLPIFVFAYNRNTSPLSIANVRMGGYSIGLSLTAAQVAAYNTAFTAFNSAIGRT